MAFKALEDTIETLKKRVGRLEGTPPTPPTPPAVVSSFAGATAPSGWLLCDGAAVSRTTYADLFAAIGTTYGAGNGSTTFNVPNLKGRTVVGQDTAQAEFNFLGETGGAKTHTLTSSEMPAHSHSVNYNNTPIAGGLPGGNAVGSFVNWFLGNSAFAADPANRITVGNTGGGGAHNNLQPYIALNFIIKT